MQEIIVKPLDSTLNVKLGETRETVINTIGSPSRTLEQSDHYQNQTPMFSIDYNKNNKVEYINISNPNSTSIKVSLLGLDVFNTSAEEIILNLKNSHQLIPDSKDPELGYSYVFLNKEFSLWRPIQHEDPDCEEGKYFECIGIGIQGYYSDGY
tara:strand:+ start:1119 stop:1577 length:459 start_codon:yes stop_codon:yes gene_type:complete